MMKLRFLNKKTNEELNIEVLTELQANKYLKKLNSDWVQLPVIEKYMDVDILKFKKLAENDTAINEKKYFITSIGKLGLNTIAGSLATAMTGLIAADFPDYSGNFYTYDGLPIQNLDNATFKSLYGEVLQKYMAFDAKVRIIKNAIDFATSQKEIEEIIIDYSDL